ESALGKRFRTPRPPGQADENPWITVVGIVADVKGAGLDAPTPDEVYRPTTQVNGLQTSLVLRAESGAPAALAAALRAQLHELDPALPLFDVAPLADRTA